MKKTTFLLLACCFALQLFSQPLKTKNVVIITLDGLRWQEIFRGADSALINSTYTDDKPGAQKHFWAATPTQRRNMMFPFLWSTVVQNGQIYGNRDLGSKDEVANSFFLSYPGYNELLTGFPDPRIKSNSALQNPNVNVLEYINQQRGFAGKVAVFASWEMFPQILNVKRSGLMVNAGFMNLELPDINEHLKYLNDLQHKSPHYMGDSTRLDFLTFEFAREYLKQYQPRVLYMAFDETDEMAHGGFYKFYMDRAHQEDAYIQQLWEYLQSTPVYKDKTTLLITCDHGRGDGAIANWRNHGFFIAPHSEQTWFAVMGPDTPALGEMRAGATTHHDQLAQTISKLLGLDFKSAAGHDVGAPINTVIEMPLLGAAR